MYLPFGVFLWLLCPSFGEVSIKYAAIIYRHGDRTPIDPYPTDPWRNESLWPVRFGQLTNMGKRQHYALGQWFRKRYSVSLNIPKWDDITMCSIINICLLFSEYNHR